MLPRPLPGIPYNKKSAQRILGDAVDLLQHKVEHGDIFGYLARLAEEMKEPVFQIFVQPIGRPWVVVNEPREAYDIMTRRAKDFDRSNFFGQIFKPILPKTHGRMPTGTEWHAHRRLVSDTMSPTFLAEVAGPQIEKSRLAAGRPFSATEDVHNNTLDIIWTATFRVKIGPNKTRAKLLADLKEIDLLDMDKPVTFPEPGDPVAFKSIITLVKSMSIPVNSPTPYLSHWLALNMRPSLISARRTKDNLIFSKSRDASEKFSEQKDASEENSDQRDSDVEAMVGLKCALELVVAKEIRMAQKQGRRPELFSQAIQDELFTFLIAGGDSSSTTFCWAIKFFTADQELQSKFRRVLKSSFKRAAEDNDLPTIEEITSTSIPYLDGVIEECPRLGLIGPATVRKALRDTTILGYYIPEGTGVFLCNNGPGFLTEYLPVDEYKRSQSSQDGKTKIPAWKNDPSKFNPERWLDKDGNFHQHAGPTNAFGAGPRSCFGRKWAHLELRIMLVLVIWNFELLPTPPALSSFKAVDGLTHSPQQCYTRLKALS
ncbi:hypothetical protein M409DRAFT_71478 [Zasmidium cellare ATCC 36951]|uniref:Cytochrome P450 n=1 Tax=Zasmidium cellare ATCC 36951 TaxID=1080233 RepID=A0A6A6BXK9_ZASCE|nr:uncharacterized protein M409DRAFT_71478 [Zasmidium cellare ATCC 36951]KAF2158788.1 hypothetical protein M409DRAFT_71478 [Zasmidium cellare ATCC 36951]